MQKDYSHLVGKLARFSNDIHRKGVNVVFNIPNSRMIVMSHDDYFLVIGERYGPIGYIACTEEYYDILKIQLTNSQIGEVFADVIEEI